MPSLPGAGALECRRNAARLACRKKSCGIVTPRRSVEICCKEPAGLVSQHGIDADGMAPAQVPIDDLIGYGQKRTMSAIAAFDLRFAADARDPFIGAGRSIPSLIGLDVLPTLREYVFPPTKQRAKQGDLRSRTRGVRDGRAADGEQIIVDLLYRKEPDETCFEF